MNYFGAVSKESRGADKKKKQHLWSVHLWAEELPYRSSEADRKCCTADVDDELPVSFVVGSRYGRSKCNLDEDSRVDNNCVLLVVRKGYLQHFYFVSLSCAC